MGNDGGSIPTRRELVKEAAKLPTTSQLKEQLLEKQEYGWTTDPISNKPLERPITSDCTGKLYNKQDLLELLILKEDDSRRIHAERVLAGNVKGLKDLVDVKLEVEAGKPGKKEVGKSERWVCPITGKPLGAGHKGVYLVPCGHAFSTTVLKEIPSEKCWQCEEAFAPNDVIPIIPTDETDIARLQLRIKTLREKGLTHSLKPAKKSKKRNKGAEANEGDVDTTTDKKKKANPPTMPEKKPMINSASAEAIMKVVREEEKKREKKRKAEPNENLEKLFSKEARKPQAKPTDFFTRGYSFPDPDNAVGTG
ncbi:DUF602-domain-containing protein [Rhizodiscina lignyota]|uniref:DUF602-domain-containing protein n=1 Tax=Rhizodiscina lignyota TaxID=1504668 RepID=A0A9P4IFB5_9PEZI|nr:DUF602-domain-containing protein [Rhizodiscina lignyota]